MSRDDVKIRKAWPKDFDPNTKAHKVKIDYNRRNNKDAIKDALEEMEEDERDLEF